MEKHDLLHEFPNHQEKIHELKVNDNHFRHLFDDYHNVNKEIHHFESGAEATTDEHLTELRMKRLHLKDEIYEYIK